MCSFSEQAQGFYLYKQGLWRQGRVWLRNNPCLRISLTLSLLQIECVLSLLVFISSTEEIIIINPFKMTLPNLYFNQVRLAELTNRLCKTSPLVHCLTNDVVVNFTANVLLAVGAAPAMVVAAQESAEFAKVASALVVNVGTVTAHQAQAMRLAVQAASQSGTPWVLDPVAYGALAFRTTVCDDLLVLSHPTVIRANAAEIAALAGRKSASKGPESLICSDDAADCAKAVAQKYKTIVAMTGQTDYVTDGQALFALSNGDALLTRVTGAGCALSALVAAYCTLGETSLVAALAALSHMALAGELAARNNRGVGHFAVSLLDHLQLLQDLLGGQKDVFLKVRQVL